MKKACSWIVLVLVLAAAAAVRAGEAPPTMKDLEHQLEVVRLTVEKETAKLQAAQAEIQRIRAIAPLLQAEEKRLLDEIEKRKKK